MESLRHLQLSTGHSQEVPEEVSLGRLPTTDWPMGKSVGYFLDS